MESGRPGASARGRVRFRGRGRGRGRNRGRVGDDERVAVDGRRGASVGEGEEGAILALLDDVKAIVSIVKDSLLLRCARTANPNPNPYPNPNSK